MKKNLIIFFIIFVHMFSVKNVLANESYFKEGEKNYNEKKYEDSKFLFQRNIVFNPRDSKSYLYLAKIYNFEENEKEEEKNLNTTLLLDPNNEEANFYVNGNRN